MKFQVNQYMFHKKNLKNHINFLININYQIVNNKNKKIDNKILIIIKLLYKIKIYNHKDLINNESYIKLIL